MINIHKKSFNSENFESDLKFERRKTDQKMYFHKQTEKSCFFITENEETMIEKEIVLGKSKSYLQMATLSLKRQFRSVYERRDPQEQFKNIFPGCRDWAICSVKLTSRNSLNKQLSPTLSQSWDSLFCITDKKVENFPSQQQQQMRNQQIDYDQSEWFDTDCSEYESEISLSSSE